MPLLVSMLGRAHHHMTLVVSLAIAGSVRAQAPAIAGVPAWTVSAAPTLRIGDDGTDHTLFTRIAAVRAPGGEIVIEDGGASELRVFSAAGQFVRNLSRKGRGPGEYMMRGALARHGDTVFVIESSLGGGRGIHAFAVGSGYVSTTPVRAANAPGGIAVRARLSGGTFLVEAGRGFKVVDPNLRVDLVVSDSTTLGIYSPADSGHVTWLGTFRRATQVTYWSPLGKGAAVPVDIPFGPKLVTGVSGDRVWLGETDSGAITIYLASGAVAARVTAPVRRRDLDQAALDAAGRSAVADAATNARRASTEAMYSKAARPAHAPRFTGFVAGADGEMWVALFAEDVTAPTRYLVMDASGKAIAQAVVAAGVTVQEIGRDYVLGRAVNADGVESIVLYTCNRS